MKRVRSLARRPARTRLGLFLAEGPQSVREAVHHRPDLVRELYVTASATNRYAALLTEARQRGVAVVSVSDEVLAAMADTDTPQGLLAVCALPTATLERVLAAGPRLVCVLAQVRDPGNAGTVLRGADAAGADAVVVTDNSVDVFGPKVVRSAAGSTFHLPVVTGVSLDAAVVGLRDAGLRVLAADGAGERLLGEVDLAAPHAWVLGNEAWGLDEADRARCDETVRVPIYGLAESLNLAMAATVCLYASAAAQQSST
ncbi:RNA methyltransferase [Lapillicoccus sp.]|uniref:TrmH family RNA methyltransferase n=1 Tax=Lapillicoccus sp. TaxID=1909287 RepID=UPI003262FAD1